jgi:hypothetical protein
MLEIKVSGDNEAEVKVVAFILKNCWEQIVNLPEYNDLVEMTEGEKTWTNKLEKSKKPSKKTQPKKKSSSKDSKKLIKKETKSSTKPSKSSKRKIDEKKAV